MKDFSNVMKDFNIEENLYSKRPLKSQDRSGFEEDLDNKSDEAIILPDGQDLGHLEAEQILEEKNLAALQAEEDKKTLEELRKNMEEDHEDTTKTNRRF
jgi:hypothetical protein